jgi:hypothetical protein
MRPIRRFAAAALTVAEPRVRAILEEARDRLGRERWHGAAAAGAHLTADDAVQLALSAAGRLVTPRR